MGTSAEATAAMEQTLTRTSLLATGSWGIIRDDRYEEFRAYIQFFSHSLDFDMLTHRKLIENLDNDVPFFLDINVLTGCCGQILGRWHYCPSPQHPKTCFEAYYYAFSNVQHKLEVDTPFPRWYSLKVSGFSK